LGDQPGLIWSPHLFDADDRAAWDLARSLPLARNVHNDHGPVPSRLSVNADVDRASILVMNGEHDLRIRPSWEPARQSSHADDGALDTRETQRRTSEADHACWAAMCPVVGGTAGLEIALTLCSSRA